MGTHLLRSPLLITLLTAAACGTTPVTTVKARTVERQLLAPYLQKRTVACNELVVEISPNFHRHVSNPGVDSERQRFERVEKVAQVDKVWTNLSGGRAGWFTVTVGAPADPTEVGASPGPRTTFKVMNQFTLRVLERGRMRLDAEAKGPILIVQEAGGEPRDLRSFAISDGAVSR
ncbi:MAG: hypothetical protein VYA51_07080 [Planctomycetota bacterium]|nr:hypothetical protein [Planctomycetota bacterium]MEC9047759.1 hypothetical protein [Planctomycetota bacterium]